MEIRRIKSGIDRILKALFEVLHVDLMLVDQLPECPAVLIRGICRMGNIALMFRQEAPYILSLKLIDHTCLSSAKAFLPRSDFIPGQGKVRGFDDSAFCQHRCGLDDVLEFPDISWPAMIGEPPH